MKRQLQDQNVWSPQTPANSTIAASLKSEDILHVRTIGSTILAKQYDGLNHSDGKIVNEESKAQSDETESFMSSASATILTQSEKVRISTKMKDTKRKRYRPKVVQEGKIKKAPTTPYPKTPKPRTPKPPNVGTSRKTFGNKSNLVLNNTFTASHRAFQDASLDFSQAIDPSPGISSDISTKDINSKVLLESCDINYVQENGREDSSLNAEECGDKKLMDLKLLADSKSCRRALNFDLLLENDRREHTKDGNASYATWQRSGNKSQMLVYRQRFKLEQMDRQNSRKFGYDFPKIIRKARTRTRSTTTFTTFITSLLAVGRQNGIMNNRLMYAITAKDIKLNMVKKRRTGRKENVFPTLPLVINTNSEQSCEQPNSTEGEQSCHNCNRLMCNIAAKDIKSNMVKKRRTGVKENVFPTLPLVVNTNSEQSFEQPNGTECEQSWWQSSSLHEISERQLAQIHVAQSPAIDVPCITEGEQICQHPSSTHETSGIQLIRTDVARSSAVDAPKMINMDSVPLLSTPKGRKINVSAPKLYRGFLVSRSGPPHKKFRVLEKIMKDFRRLHIGNIGKRPGPKKKVTSGVGIKSGELVLCDLKKHVPKVAIDQETEREWKLLMQVFCGGADEERGGDRKKWWEEQRKIFRVRTLTFIAIMHIIQGDRRFSEWKGSVVDSVVGVFLTQNVSDLLSSSAYMSLASRFPIKPTNELDTETIPIVEEVEPERGECSIDNHPMDKESVLQAGTASVTMINDSGKNQAEPTNWDELRKTYGDDAKRETSGRYSDSVDWEAVRLAPAKEVADAIKMRGQQFVIGSKIQAFLNRVVKDHGSIDLEWLRNVPPYKAKKYLLSFHGLGLKSVECIRLLCLHHHAFPVDINVARVAVRLGWVPIQPLPGGLEFHLLEQYPVMDAVQVFLWPRLCMLDQKTLYELHYQMITFGKVFCKKQKPSCGTCPMRGECKHHASEVASFRRSLPSTKEESTSSAIVSISDIEDLLKFKPTVTETFPPSSYQKKNVEPIIEYPASPVQVSNEDLGRDIEDWRGQADDDYRDVDVDLDEDRDVVVNVNVDEDDNPTIRLGTEEWNENEDDIPTIRLGSQELEKRFREAMHESDIVLPEDDVSKALTALTSEASSIPAPKLKNVGRLKTVHHVYELPDSHPILTGVQRREPDDPSPYLLVIWASDAEASHSKPFRSQSCSRRLELCDVGMFCSSDNIADQNSETVPGTLMIPCRTANKGRFPLNGTYFQVNEVFADDESAKQPIQVPRKWLWNLRRRFLYCGSSASAIFTGCSMEEIQHCFWRGFICVRAFDRRTRAPIELPKKFHVSTTSKVEKGKGKRKFTPGDKEEVKENTPRSISTFPYFQ